MRLSATYLALLAIVGSTSAQYYSAGWKPGDKVHDEAATATVVAKPSQAAANAPPPPKGSPFSLSSLLDVNKLLLSQPAVSLFSRFGINLTEKFEATQLNKLWDERIEFITDDNYNDVIVNETLTEEEEEKRVWILIISVTSAQQEGISKFMDSAFDEAFNETVIAGDLPHVKWGRIDYLTVTHITTKWAVWRAPTLVILTNRGKSLRFYRPHEIRMRADALRAFLNAEGWKQTAPWSSAYSPGGDREYIMEYIAVYFTKFYNFSVKLPKWVLFMISGSLASLVLGVLHRPSKKKPEESKPAVDVVKEAAADPTTNDNINTSGSVPTPANTDSERESSAPPAKRASTRQRKNKK